jgi:hypothetical protein
VDDEVVEDLIAGAARLRASDIFQVAEIWKLMSDARLDAFELLARTPQVRFGGAAPWADSATV